MIKSAPEYITVFFSGEIQFRSEGEVTVIVGVLIDFVIGALPLNEFFFFFLNAFITPIVQRFFTQIWAHFQFDQNIEELDFVETPAVIMSAAGP